MKLTREYQDETQARGQERALKAMGYRAWLNRNRDGNWQLYWLEPSN